MPALILPLIEAVAHWPERGALVGLDLGTKTIGVAVSDPDRRLATGVGTILRKTFTIDAARVQHAVQAGPVLRVEAGAGHAVRRGGQGRMRHRATAP